MPHHPLRGLCMSLGLAQRRDGAADDLRRQVGQIQGIGQLFLHVLAVVASVEKARLEGRMSLGCYRPESSREQHEGPCRVERSRLECSVLNHIKEVAVASKRSLGHGLKGTWERRQV